MFNLFDLFKKKKTADKDNPKITEQKGKKEKKKDLEKEYIEEVEKSINVYVMPERFRGANKHKSKAKTTGIIIIVGGAIFLISVSFLLYYYLIKGGSSETGPVATSTAQDINIPKETTREEPTSKPITEPVTVKDPKQSYMEMKAEFDRAVNFNSFESVVIKYGSKNKIAQLEREKRQVENTEGSSNETITSLTLRMAMPKLAVLDAIKVDVNGNTATLTTATSDLTKKGTIIMVKENNIWKLGSEIWEENQKIIEIPVEPLATSNGVDSDSDGLTNKEENILGSNPGKTDSDGDGYNDLNEVMSLYNPAGTNKLEDSASIKKYSSNTYKYSLIYPASWTINNVGGDDSVMFRSADNHFIQIISQQNTSIQSIEDWYKQQFDVSSIGNVIKADSWQGIKNEDGFTIYLTDNERKFIFTITYNFGNQNILEYKNIFEMIIKSFIIQN